MGRKPLQQSLSWHMCLCTWAPPCFLRPSCLQRPTVTTLLRLTTALLQVGSPGPAIMLEGFDVHLCN